MKKLVVMAAFYLLLAVAWQAACSLGAIPDYLLPSPAQVAARLAELWRDGVFLPSLQATLLRMLAGFALASAAGFLLGLLMGTLPHADRCLRSLLLGLQTLPSAAWVPISLLIFGLRDSGIYFVIVMSSMGAVSLSVADGIAHIPPLYLRAARTLGTPGHAMWHRVILPAALPGIATGIKLGWTMGWHGAVSAELIKSSIGLGFLLHMGRELNDVAQVVGLMLVMVLIGSLAERLVFGVLEHRIRLRWGLAQGA